jgi:hypothetical protein
MNTYPYMYFVLLGICALLIGICYYKKTMILRKMREIRERFKLLYERWFNWSKRELIEPYVTKKYGSFFYYINLYIVSLVLLCIHYIYTYYLRFILFTVLSYWN